ncbi:MAG: hypothetical protein KDC87_16775 [Planctomycetes bacterium]|nr:hypothetical protein [Planctomycetota bacterium]
MHCPVDDLPRRLASANPVAVAWASYRVRRDRVRSAIPAVRAALARLVRRTDLDGRLARLHLIDTLIQLDVRVPGEELLPHAIDDLRVPALILAAKAKEANIHYFATRFAALAKQHDLEWLVCGNLLANLRERDFAKSCLEHLVLDLRFDVVDDRAPRSRGVG